MPVKQAPAFLEQCPICDGTGKMQVEESSKEIEGIVVLDDKNIKCVACKGSGWISHPLLYDKLKQARFAHDTFGNVGAVQ